MKNKCYLKQQCRSLFLGLFFVMNLFFGCDEKNDSSQEEEALQLKQMLEEIQQMAANVPCNDASLWFFTPYGSKACGGPVGFIAYPVLIDVDLFLKKVEEHTETQHAFNVKWGVMSDCSVPVAPNGIVCKDGKPHFVYNDWNNKIICLAYKKSKKKLSKSLICLTTGNLATNTLST